MTQYETILFFKGLSLTQEKLWQWYCRQLHKLCLHTNYREDELIQSTPKDCRMDNTICNQNIIFYILNDENSMHKFPQTTSRKLISSQTSPNKAYTPSLTKLYQHSNARKLSKRSYYFESGIIKPMKHQLG
ncbi:unnamed protein product [Ilex paraguariensis]|uniref:Uncharacterized protein n=1 Tax=Ilex paraguariensis TaxID=185542 RepID=A0ABC8S609_9AQUA